MSPKASRNSDAIARIRHAALKLFAKRGFEATGIRDIAVASGLSLSTLYHYVDSKEQLLLEIVTASQTELRESADEALATATTPTERLEALVRSHVLRHGESQLEALVADLELRAMSKANRKKMVAVRDSYEALWQEALDDGVEAGEFHCADTHLVRLGILQMCTGVAYWYTANGPRTIVDIAETFAELAVSMASSVPRRREAGASIR